MAWEDADPPHTGVAARSILAHRPIPCQTFSPVPMPREPALRTSDKSGNLTYRDAGVDIDAGEALVDNIKPYAKRTLRPEVLAGIGGFGALCGIPAKYREPVLVSGTDGVGTKLKLAFELDRHDTIGIDLVAMSVNDILVQGAEPLFFLAYVSCGKLDVATATRVVRSIAAGCEQAGCALIGGETAQMPRMYSAGRNDTASHHRHCGDHQCSLVFNCLLHLFVVCLDDHRLRGGGGGRMGWSWAVFGRGQ